MINPQELLQDFKDLGYNDKTALAFAKIEFSRRVECLRKTQQEFKNSRSSRLCTNGLLLRPYTNLINT